MHRSKRDRLSWLFILQSLVKIHLAVAACIGSTLLVSDRVHGYESHRSTTSKSARQEALRAIPLENLPKQHRQQVQAVLEQATLYRRLPTCVVDCHPNMFTYMARNPEVMVAIWRELGVSQVQLQRISPNTFHLKDSAGTTGKLVLVEEQCEAGAQNRLIMLAEGSYESTPLSHPVKAQCVFLLRSGSIKETNGRRYVAARLDSFIRIEGASLQWFAKVLHPWVGTTADRNFSDTLTFVGNLSKTAEVRPQAIGKLAGKLSEVSHTRQKQLVQLAYQCEDDSHRWKTAHKSQDKLQRARLARFSEVGGNVNANENGMLK
jgi:hypothetical protein